MKRSSLLFVAALVLTATCCFGADTRSRERPNIIFLLADDLGYGDVGAYGQKIIRTPNIDQLARDGMRLTHHYSGHNVCAPSRCVLMTGLHPGHAYIRNNRGGVGQRDGSGAEGQEPVPPGELKLPLVLKQLGYTGYFFRRPVLGADYGRGATGATGAAERFIWRVARSSKVHWTFSPGSSPMAAARGSGTKTYKRGLHPLERRNGWATKLRSPRRCRTSRASQASRPAASSRPSSRKTRSPATSPA